MTREELEKAIKCCNPYDEDCGNCPFNNLPLGKCFESLAKSAFNRLLDDREKLQKQVNEYQDKIEQGTLIELPCKGLGAVPCEMGATVWLIYKRHWNVADKNGFWVLRESKVSPHNKKRFSDDFGKFVFLTREEAEKRLEELKGGKE